MIHTEEERSQFISDTDEYGREYAEAKHGYDRSNTNKVGVILLDYLCSVSAQERSVNDKHSK